MDRVFRVKENKGLARCFRDTVRKKKKNNPKNLAIEDTRKGRIWIQAAYRGKKMKGKKPKNLLSCGADQEKRWWFYYAQWMMSVWEALIIAFLKCDSANGFAAVWLREVGPFFFPERRRTYLDDRNSYCPRCTILAPTESFRSDSFRHSISVPWKKGLPFSKSL